MLDQDESPFPLRGSAGARLDVHRGALSTQPFTEAIRAFQNAAQAVTLHRSQIIHQHNQSTSFIYLLASGLVSASIPNEKRGFTEVMTSGRGDFVGLINFIAPNKLPYRAIVQVTGTAYRLTFSELRELIQSDTCVRDLLYSALGDLVMQQSILIACNKTHPLRQRLARYLLSMSDQLNSKTVGLTHTSIADALGVRRTGITDHLNMFSRDGLIECQRGQIVITDCERLDENSCGCHAKLTSFRRMA